MLIRRLKVAGLLSFGPEGIDVPLGQLNVLIGANGTGKSNLLEVLNLLRAAPTSLPSPVKEMGGVREWMWKGADSKGLATIDVFLVQPAKMDLRHELKISEHGSRFEVVDERIENEKPLGDKKQPFIHYHFRQGNPVLNEVQGKERGLKRATLKPEESILSQVKDPERYRELGWLQSQYEGIRLFRNWSFGPNAPLRREQSTLGRSDFLSDGGENLSLVLSNIRHKVKPEFLAALQKLYSGIEDFSLQIDGGNALLFLEERGGRSIPSTRLSDGTLRYLCLLAILLHPNPPPLVAIEEPELGLHPDIVPAIAELLKSASARTQLVVTTHSRVLIDALSDDPSTVLVCDKENGRSRFERLEQAALRVWLEKYSLGQLWSMGELGGNRW